MSLNTSDSNGASDPELLKENRAKLRRPEGRDDHSMTEDMQIESGALKISDYELREILAVMATARNGIEGIEIERHLDSILYLLGCAAMRDMEKTSEGPSVIEIATRKSCRELLTRAYHLDVDAEEEWKILEVSNKVAGAEIATKAFRLLLNAYERSQTDEDRRKIKIVAHLIQEVIFPCGKIYTPGQSSRKSALKAAGRILCFRKIRQMLNADELAQLIRLIDQALSRVSLSVEAVKVYDATLQKALAKGDGFAIDVIKIAMKKAWKKVEKKFPIEN